MGLKTKQKTNKQTNNNPNQTSKQTTTQNKQNNKGKTNKTWLGTVKVPNFAPFACMINFTANGSEYPTY